MERVGKRWAQFWHFKNILTGTWMRGLQVYGQIKADGTA